MRIQVSVIALSFLAQACVGTTGSELRSAVRGLDDPDALVLRVKVLAVEFTDRYNARDCPESDDASTICVPMYFWFKYRAKVMRVVKGQWQGQQVEFANYQHGQYVDRLVKDCYVILTKADSQFRERVGVPYIAQDVVFPKSQYDRARVRTIQDGT